jgi:sulfite reductase (NADPH) hemoprotein beta-component
MTEQIKKNSNYLRGNLAQDLQNQITGSLTNDNHQLIKFHGIYEQDDRDRRQIRMQKKLEKDYSFMIRLRIPGGRITSKQWMGINEVADLHSNGAIKITTRQTVQLHGVIKSKLKPTVQYFDRFELDSIAACGDVNRNVISSAYGEDLDELHKLAVTISEEFLPKTNAYKEIWLDGQKIQEDEEPIYGNVYLPRKFKIAIANPPYNDVDVYAHDIGLVKVKGGYNIIVGGGMGMTHGNIDTYPRIGSLIGFAIKSKIIEVIKQIILIQRDFGNRENRKLARLKYTIDRLGLNWFIDEFQKRVGFDLKEAKEFSFTKRSDQFGWDNNRFTLFVENGRVTNNVKEALLEIAKHNFGNFNFTNNQNIIITEIKNRNEIENILNQYQLDNNQTKIKQAAIACVALNTCPLALAEAQRYMPSLLDKIEKLLEKHSLENEEISIRMTGCPNGCARPYLAEIAFVGKSLGKYNMYVGADHLGQRLNKLYKESLDEKQILQELDYLFNKYSSDKKQNETFGNFIINNKII